MREKKGDGRRRVREKKGEGGRRVREKKNDGRASMTGEPSVRHVDPCGGAVAQARILVYSAGQDPAISHETGTQPSMRISIQLAT